MGRLATVALAVWLAEPSAWAASYDAQIEVITSRSFEIATRVEELEAETRPGTYLTEDEALVRFEDALFQHLVGEHAAAAEQFFTLVTTAALVDGGLHRDAQWYLGEALLGMENFDSAASQFRSVVADETHPFRDDGVRRLLEIYARSGDRAAFRALYEAEIVSGRVEPTGLITYSLAKSFYRQGDHDDAVRTFAEVPEGDAWFTRARYFLGTIAVVRGDLEAADAYFAEVTEREAEDAEQRKVRDLGLLARGRLAYHAEDYLAASEFYGRLGDDSAFQDDKLYELTWTAIRRGRWQEALSSVEIFLLAFPDHEYTAQLTLLQGHLSMQEENFDRAMVAYDQVVREYSPVRDRFDQLARPEADAEAEVREVIEDEEGAATALPSYAIAMMRDDPVLVRAMEVFRHLMHERDQLEASQALIDELQTFLARTSGVGPYEPLRLEAIERRGDIVRQQLALLAAQSAWLKATAPTVASEVSALETRRVALEGAFSEADAEIREARAAVDAFEKKVGALRAEAMRLHRASDADQAEAEDLRSRLALPSLSADKRQRVQAELSAKQQDLADATARLAAIDQELGAVVLPDVLSLVSPDVADAVHADVSALAEDFARLRSRADEVRGAPQAEQIASADMLFSDAYGRLAGVVDAVRLVEDDESVRLREMFDAEVTEVTALREEHARTLEAAREVSLELTREGLARLRDEFASSVLKADMGLVDIFWAQKLGVADELARLRGERDAVIANLQRRFELIREKMGDEP